MVPEQRLGSAEVHFLRQEKVPALLDVEARIAAKETSSERGGPEETRPRQENWFLDFVETLFPWFPDSPLPPRYWLIKWRTLKFADSWCRNWGHWGILLGCLNLSSHVSATVYRASFWLRGPFKGRLRLVGKAPDFVPWTWVLDEVPLTYPRVLVWGGNEGIHFFSKTNNDKLANG